MSGVSTLATSGNGTVVWSVIVIVGKVMEVTDVVVLVGDIGSSSGTVVLGAGE
jgi:hypothetical protein